MTVLIYYIIQQLMKLFIYKKKILDLVEKAGENKKNNLHISTIQKDVKFTSSLILNKKNNIENICAKFDSLHFVINTYIK